MPNTSYSTGSVRYDAHEMTTATNKQTREEKNARIEDTHTQIN